HYKLYYYFAKARPEELREPYFDFLAEGLRNIGQNEWLKNLKGETELIELTILIQQSGLDLKLSVKFRDALEDHYKQVYSGETNPPGENLITNWNSLLDALDVDIKNTFLKNIKFYIEREDDGSAAIIGKLYD